MSVHLAKIIVTRMLLALTLLGALIVSAILDLREMESTVQVCLVGSALSVYLFQNSTFRHK